MLTEDLHKLYIEEKLSTRQIARKLGVSPSTAWKLLKKEGIKTRPQKKYSFTKEQLEKLYYEDNLSQSEIAKKFGIKNGSGRIAEYFKKFGIKSRPFSTAGLKFPGKKVSDEVKEKLRKWHTGRKLSPEHRKKCIENLKKTWEKRRLKEGTIRISQSRKNRYIIKIINGRKTYLHRYIASKKLGRDLVKGEEVHHINFNSLDNRPENLLVLFRNEHLKLHSQLELTMRELMEKGIVVFKNGKYIASV